MFGISSWRWRRFLFFCLLVTAVIGGTAVTVHVLAQSGGSFTLAWASVDGGGGASGGGSYALQGTAGQPDAGVLSGGSYVLGGGFWPGGAAQTSGESVFLPLIIRAP